MISTLVSSVTALIKVRELRHMLIRVIVCYVLIGSLSRLTNLSSCPLTLELDCPICPSWSYSHRLTWLKASNQLLALFEDLLCHSVLDHHHFPRECAWHFDSVVHHLVCLLPYTFPQCHSTYVSCLYFNY